jgi:hypothetical protein
VPKIGLQGSCPFSYTNPGNVNFGRCGEVDASSRMPGDIWGYPTAVQRYVDATLKYYNIGDNGGPEGGVLAQAPCDHTTRFQKGNKTVSWTDPELMRQTCSVRRTISLSNVCPHIPPILLESFAIPLRSGFFFSSFRIFFFFFLVFLFSFLIKS